MNRVAFFDSGIGGLNVLRDALKMLPDEDYIYYADSENTPYGVKPKKEVRRLVSQAVEFLYSRGIKALVVACNTATSVAIEDLREKYTLPVIGMEPAVKPALEAACGKKVLVAATPLTLKEDKLLRLINRLGQAQTVDFLPLPELVDFAEAGVFDGPDVTDYLKASFSTYRMEDYSSLVLGCTHFCSFRDEISKILPKDICIVDGNIGTVRYLKRVLEEKNLTGGGSGKVEYFVSGRKADEKEKTQFERILGLPHPDLSGLLPASVPALR